MSAFRLSPRIFAAAFVALLILAMALRYRGIQRWALNNDEVFEVTASKFEFGDMIEYVKRDAVHPPLDYAVQYGLSQFNVPEWSRRLPSVTAGVLTIAIVTVLGTMWGGGAAGLIAGLLLAVAPMHIRYSQEVRPYSLALMFLCASLLALEFYARRNHARWAVAWALLVYLSAATLYFAGLVAGVTGMVWIVLERTTRLRALSKRLPLVIAAWGLAYSAWFAVMHRAATSSPPQDADRLDWPWWQFRLHAYATGDYQREALNAGSWALWVAVLIGTLVAMRNPNLRPVLAWFYLCGALQIVALQLRPHFNDPRYVLSSMPAAYLLAGAGAAYLLTRRSTASLGVSIVLLFVAFSAVRLNDYYRGGRSDWREVMQYVRERARPGDTIVLANEWALRNFGHYWLTQPKRADVKISGYSFSWTDLEGPAWIVTGQCTPGAALGGVGLMKEWPHSEVAQVRYLRRGQRLSLRAPPCN